MSSNNINKLNIKSEKKIVCKYFIVGKCIKGEKCPYLHSQLSLQKEALSQRECPMYSIGYCKNGPMCKFIHIKKSNSETKDEKNMIKSDEIDDECSTPYDGDSITISYHEEKEEIKEKEIENKNDKIIPIWYLEHYYEKPITKIFAELENKNLPEIIKLREKYGLGKKENNINMNLNFNNIDMNFALNNYYSFNIPPLLNNPYDFNNNYFYNSNPYMNQIDYIEYIINNFKIFYHFVKFTNNKYVNKCLLKNKISIPYQLYKKYKNINLFQNNYIVIVFIYNIEREEFAGFAKLEYPIKYHYNSYKKKFKINWLWKYGIDYSEVSHLVNKLNHNRFLCEGKNWCPIHPDLGHYMCRLMIKRLNQEEIFELINEKQIFQEQIRINNYRNKKIYEEEESLDEEYSNKSNKDNNYIKKRKKYHEDLYSDESDEDMKLNSDNNELSEYKYKNKYKRKKGY